MVNKTPSCIDLDFWRGKKVLITGHSGFKGGWLTIWLEQLGCKVTGISLRPITTPALFEIATISSLCDSHFIDIRDLKSLIQLIENTKPEIVFHLAAQPLVRQSYVEPIETFSTNTIGSSNILEAVRVTNSVKVVVMVTTDKVYEINEKSTPYKEGDSLGGFDPYSASKAASELIIDCYRNSFLKSRGVAVASARAGNVIGGGDWSEDRLIPDAIRAWSAKENLILRYPKSIRPWQHVLDPLYGYIILAQLLAVKPDLAGSFNFGPVLGEPYSVERVIEFAQLFWNDAQFQVEKNSVNWRETAKLQLDTKKAYEVLGIRSVWNTEKSVKQTILWYQKQALGADAITLCKNDIKDYQAYLIKNNEEQNA